MTNTAKNLVKQLHSVAQKYFQNAKNVMRIYTLRKIGIELEKKYWAATLAMISPLFVFHVLKLIILNKKLNKKNIH